MYLAFSLMEDCCKLTEGSRRQCIQQGVKQETTSARQTSRGLVHYFSEQTYCIRAISILHCNAAIRKPKKTATYDNIWELIVWCLQRLHGKLQRVECCLKLNLNMQLETHSYFEQCPQRVLPVVDTVSQIHTPEHLHLGLA